MPYSQGRIVHDADAHIMETPTWLREHAEAAYRDRLRSCATRAGTSCARPATPPSSSATSWLPSTRCGPGTPRPSTGPTRRPRSWRARTSPPRAPSSPRTARVPWTSSGFSSQLVFNTFHNGRLHDMEHADADLAYAAARAHNRGMLEFCSVDPRLLPSLYVPLVDPARAVAATRDALATAPPHCWSPRAARRGTRPATPTCSACGPRPRTPASPSCSTSAAPGPSSTPATSSTASRSRPTSTAARRTSAPSTTWASRSRRPRRWPR